MDLSLLVYVLLIIAFAKAMGEVVSRANQPPIVGEMLAGIILGPFILGAIFSELGPMYDADGFVQTLGDLGMLFLMLYVGLEFSPGLLKASSYAGAVIAACGILVPLSLGLLISTALGFTGHTLVFVAVVMSVTALPVTVRVLKDMEVLNTRTGAVIVNAAVLTDISLLFALGVILGASSRSETLGTISYLAVSFALFFVLAVVVGRYVVPHIYRLLRRMRTGEAAFAVAVGIAIAFAVFAEWAGMPGVVGAFVAGLLLRETGASLKVWARVEDILSGVTIGFLAPVFFVVIGFSVDFRAVLDHLPVFAVIVIAAVCGKLLASSVSARVMGYGRNESVAIGSMMMGKGAVELVFARIALDAGLIEPYLFSILVLDAFLSTVLAPVLFRKFFNMSVRAGEIDGRASTPSEASSTPRHDSS
jgi:Kef-type K+ transport system membrane component KefB